MRDTALVEQDNIDSVDAIWAAEKFLLGHVENHADVHARHQTTHYRINGVYVRSIFIPAGDAITGKIHNKENISILAQGTLRITNGEEFKVISAPYVMVDKPGIKRLGYAETDCTFLTIHRTDSDTIQDIEIELVSDTYEEYERKTLARPTS